MTPPLSPVNIAAFALQVLVIVGAGALLLRAFRIDAPRAVLAYWRILLLAIEQKIAGDVQVEMTLDEHGEVSDARVLSGPEELRKALESVLQWHSSPAALKSTTTSATLRFRVPPPNTEQERKEKMKITLEAVSKMELAHHRLQEMAKAIADPTTTDEQRRRRRGRTDDSGEVSCRSCVRLRPFGGYGETAFALDHERRLSVVWPCC